MSKKTNAAVVTPDEFAGAVYRSSLPSQSRLALVVLSMAGVSESEQLSQPIASPVRMPIALLSKRTSISERTLCKYLKAASDGGWLTIERGAEWAFCLRLTAARLADGRAWLAERQAMWDAAQ
jgi:hypothetical protein